MSKEPRYNYGGKVWSDDDLSEEVEDYGGSLYDLYWELRKAGVCYETTFYNTEEKTYESYEDLLVGLARDGRISDHG